jgi:SAM-dependent methyltransferase
MSTELSFLQNKNKISFTTYDNICSNCNTYNYPWIVNCSNCNKHLNQQNVLEFNCNEYQRKSNEVVYKIFIKKYNINTNIILDIGCSYGSWYERFKNMGFNIIYGIDVNETVIEYAKKKYNKCIVGTSQDIINNFDNLDVISCNAVIIHIKEYEEIDKLFNNVYNALNNNGYFIISIPHIHNKIQCNSETVFNHNIEYYENIILKNNFKIIEKLGTFSYVKKSNILNNKLSINNAINNENDRSNIKLFYEILYLLMK